MPGETDLATLVATLRPKLDPATYVWCSVEAIPEGVHPIAVVSEAEGTTIVVTVPEAVSANLDHAFTCRRITLEAHSALEAVGLTAAFSRALADARISANVVAGYHHDHVFVPADRADEAMATLAALSATAVIPAVPMPDAPQAPASTTIG